MIIYKAEMNGPGAEMKYSRGIYYVWDSNVELSFTNKKDEKGRFPDGWMQYRS